MKSFRSILNDRVTSPFYGTLIISWSLWNWKFLYITFFISEINLSVNKMEYILTNCSDWKTLILYPIISTIILITVFPLITNGAYLITLLYNKWKVNKKNEIENKQLLSLAESIHIRSEIRDQEEKFKNFLESKNNELENLNRENELLQSSRAKMKKERGFNLENIVSNFNSIKQFQVLIKQIENDYSLVGSLTIKDIDLYIRNNIIKPKKEEGYFIWTTEGKKLLKQFQDFIDKEGKL